MKTEKEIKKLKNQIIEILQSESCDTFDENLQVHTVVSESDFENIAQQIIELL